MFLNYFLVVLVKFFSWFSMVCFLCFFLDSSGLSLGDCSSNCFDEGKNELENLNGQALL